MFKSNLVKQNGFKDCGPACLLMIIKHYKGYVDIEELKEMCKTDKNGTDAYHLIEAAKKCGFEANGYRMNLEDMKEVVLPCIAHVILNNSYLHYLVISKIDFKKKKLYVMDPRGIQKYYSFEDFEKIFNHIVINLYPVRVIPLNHKNSLFEFIKNVIFFSKGQFILISITSIVITTLSILLSFYFQNMLDSTTNNKIIFTFSFSLMLLIFKLILTYIRNYLTIIINQKTEFYLINKTFKEILFLPYQYYRNHTTGEIISRLSHLDIIRQTINHVLLCVTVDFPLIIIIFITMFFLNETLFFISFIILCFYLLLILIFHKPYKNNIENVYYNKANVDSYMVESINGFESVKGCNNENKILNIFQRKYSSYLKHLKDFEHIYNLQIVLNDFVCNFSYLIIILIGMFLLNKDEITLGVLLTFYSLLSYFFEPMQNCVQLNYLLEQTKDILTKLLKMFHDKKENGILNENMIGNIEIKDLSYSFGEKLVLSHINLKIQSGSKVMILGQSGSGKSTLCKILKRYYPISRNKVMINENDILDYKNNDIVYISQNEILFTDSIYNNIDSEDILNVSKICLVDEIIEKNPLGYYTIIEENGFNLSGGERQRIILARSISKPFSILIIDEGLNQVDIDMERRILKKLFDKFFDKTIIMVSHRDKNRDLFDQVITMKEGKVIKNVKSN